MIERTNLPSGPWDDEPDSLSWEDAGTGLPCFIRRDSELGFLCGYIGVPKTHPWHGKKASEAVPAPKHLTDREASLDEVGVLNVVTADADQLRENLWPISLLISCHGGMTYSGEAYWGDTRATWWFGFDCTHAGDVIPAVKRQMFHGEQYRDIEYVKNVCRKACRDIVRGAIRIVDDENAA